MKVKKILAFMISILSIFSLSACSVFMASDGTLIDTITSEYNEEDGTTTVTITFIDTNTPEVTFTIPRGEQGENGLAGVGISSIEETENNTLLITFTNDTTEEIPLDLVDITDISSTYDPNLKQTIVTITTTKGDYTFNINDALGIVDITNSQDAETGDILIEISLTDGTTKEILIPKGEKGDEGRGIESIVSTENNIEYILNINYTDGSTDTIVLSKPKSTIWYSGSGAPNNIALGILPNDGDFYFDRANFRFYQYDGQFTLSWQLVADLGLSGEDCTVTFNAVANGGAIISGESVIECQKGDYISLADIPVAFKEGYTFVGWYTSQNAYNNPNAQKFSDLTPVLSDLTLYANFILNE